MCDKNIAKAIYNKVAPPFKQTFNTSFAQALSKIAELNLQHKDKIDRKDRRNNYRHSRE